MISKATSYTIVIFAAMLFAGAVFYVFAVMDLKSNGKMSGGGLLPGALSTQEELNPPAPKIEQEPKPTPARPVAPTTETAKTTETTETAETIPPTPPVSPAPEPAPESGPKTHIVSIESNGFNPKLINISVGDKVVWVNNNSKLHWPASDPHPTHTGLPDFDPFADLLPGETFSYTFTNAGAFSYHDHTQAVVEDVATLTGVVRVLEK